MTHASETPTAAPTSTPAEPEQQTAPPLPEVRQCQDPANFLYGSSAVNAGEDRWGVFNPTNGGHWAKDADVADWKVLT